MPAEWPGGTINFSDGQTWAGIGDNYPINLYVPGSVWVFWFDHVNPFSWRAYTGNDAHLASNVESSSGHSFGTVQTAYLTNGADVVQDGIGGADYPGTFHNATVHMLGGNDTFFVTTDNKPTGTIDG